MSQIKRVAVCIPALDMVHTEFMRCLVEMMIESTMWAQRSGIEGMSTHIFQSSMLPQSRNVLAQSSIEIGATHTLWIDSDMTFPRDMLLRMAKHSEPIVGINAIQRKAPFNCSAQANGEQVVTTSESTGLLKVSRTGFGVMWVATEVFQKLEKPWFHYEWLSDMEAFRGEDYFFCERAVAAGYPVHIDQDLSREVGHFGTFSYSPVLKHQAQKQASANGMTPHGPQMRPL